jgi:hypothetical protein
MQELNGSNPPDGTPVSTDDLLLAIGQLYIQVQILQRMLRRELEANATQERQVQSKDN